MHLRTADSRRTGQKLTTRPRGNNPALVPPPPTHRIQAAAFRSHAGPPGIAHAHAPAAPRSEESPRSEGQTRQASLCTENPRKIHEGRSAPFRPRRQHGRAAECWILFPPSIPAHVSICGGRGVGDEAQHDGEYSGGSAGHDDTRGSPPVAEG
ncbi:hypothetical protein THAOC_19202 [Thalassiosira oceanica]|uniref:Uncharacterized protein n=1 Tax=Thalassiosira oceanica TaxID=159749 RepID=K0S2W2_THAOC|nr:hypothetical protein THAOC_19202 [Thalassiosira oceanica]|eukprot:EJK60448.1 hypothetical protein THAOC_19202 [Thalassiosira oceanica]